MKKITHLVGENSSLTSEQKESIRSIVDQSLTALIATENIVFRHAQAQEQELAALKKKKQDEAEGINLLTLSYTHTHSVLQSSLIPHTK